MSRLVVVSNRVPGPARDGTQAGGLAVALNAALEDHGGLWFGWSGATSAPGEECRIETRREGNVDFAVVGLTQDDLDQYYLGFANRALWPLFHYRLDLVDFVRSDFDGYMRVNQRFAALLAPLLKPDDIIWVHDYHLMPLADELRKLGVRNRIGFFLHIPCPPADVLLTLPVADGIMRGLAAYDQLGFQTSDDAENFSSTLVRLNLARRRGDSLIGAGGGEINVDAFPIGIETADYAAMAARMERNPLVQRLKESLVGRHLVIGVDRLDYSKGIPERIEAFSRFIDTNPAARRRVVFLQVTPKSRSEVPEYADMQRQVAEMAGRVNGAHGDLDWTPIRYVNRTVARGSLAGLYRFSRVGLVTPLRDGMNLVAKEYVASQNGEDPGVLVLSRFAGAARELDGALIVNPHDADEMATAIADALAMPLQERIARWRGMYARIHRNDITRWCETFLAALSQSTAPETARFQLAI